MTYFVEVEGVRYELDGALLNAIRARIDGDSPPRFITGCERCQVVCVLWAVDCHCCEVYGTNTGGGTVYYPNDGLGHRILMSTQEFVERMRARVAA